MRLCLPYCIIIVGFILILFVNLFCAHMSILVVLPTPHIHPIWHHFKASSVNKSIHFGAILDWQ
ncbi:hypothetical protein CPC08DRAFT_475198 [Agrocybe pediades]|nr:hypothetical protein CPC08DRAFT_475198 [Agrocybe pediades]